MSKQPDNMDMREKAVRLWELSVRLDDEIFHAPATMSEEAFTALEEAMMDAREAFEACPLRVMTDFNETRVLRCGACDAPLVEGDELLEDAYTGELFLRSALGLPARPKEPEGQLLPDMADQIDHDDQQVLAQQAAV